jgi:acetyl esterase/lipase
MTTDSGAEASLNRARRRSRWVLAAAFMMAALAVLAVLAVTRPADALNALATIGTYRAETAVPYGPLPRHKLDVYAPRTPAPPGGFALVVFFYGGSWNRGERAEYRFAGEALAARGVLVLLADYRLYPEVRYPDFLSDCALALAYGLREAARLGGDPRRVFVMGHSAGAYNAAMLALDAQRLAPTGRSAHELAGWIGLAGPYDFLPMKNPDTRPVFFHPNYPPGTQPIAYASAQAPRSFLGAALEDVLIDPQRNTVGLAKRLRDAGARVDLKLYPRVNHMTLVAALAWPLQWLAPVLDDVVAFIEAAPAR